MHAVLITFCPETPEQEFQEIVGPRLHKMASTTPGFIMKTFMAPDPAHWGGFYLFTSKETADAYLEGEFFQWFSKSRHVSDVKTQHFFVEDEPSKAFGTPSVPFAERTAA